MKANIAKYGKNILTEGISGKPGEETIEHLTRQMAKGGAIAFGGSLIGKMLGFGFSIMLGRVLGASGYGLYALGMSITGIAQSIAPLGLNQGVIRFCSIYKGKEDKTKVKGTFLSAIGISGAFSILVTFILFFSSDRIASSFFNESSLSWILKIFALSIPFSVITSIMASFTQSFKRIDYQQGISILRQLFNIILVGIAFIIGFRLKGAVYGFLIAGMLATIIALYFTYKIFPEILLTLRPNFNEFKGLLGFSLPMVFVSLLYFLMLKTDRIMLGIFRDVRDVGIYSAAANITLQLSIIHTALVTIFMPIIADIYNRQAFSEVKKLYNSIKRWSSYGTACIILPVIFYPKIFMSIYGNEFLDGCKVLILLSLVYIVGAITGPTGALLQMTGKQNIEFLNGFLIIISNILFNYFLIPIYGYLGAAVATLLAISFLNVIQVLEIHRFFKFHPFDFVHIKFISIIVIVFIVSIIINIFISLDLKLLFFLLIMSLFITYGYKNLNKEDKTLWKGIKRKFLSIVL